MFIPNPHPFQLIEVIAADLSDAMRHRKSVSGGDGASPLPDEEKETVTPEVMEVAELIVNTVAVGTQGPASPVYGPHVRAAQVIASVIPPDSVAHCHTLLVAFCFDGDSFGARVRELAYHAGIHCPDTKVAVLVTSQWDAQEWASHQRALNDLPMPVLIYFAGPQRLGRIA